MSTSIVDDRVGIARGSMTGFTVFLVGDKSQAMRKVLKHSLKNGMAIVHVDDPSSDLREFPHRSVVMIDHAFDRPTLDLVSKSLERNLPLVVGSSQRLPDRIWNLKSEAQARGLIFEVATSHKDYPFRINSTLRAIGSRWEQSRKNLGASRLPLENEDSRKLSPEPSESDWDKLSELPGVNKATQLLRSSSGRLDASKVMELFNLTRKALGDLIGHSPESIRQTPDSKSLQDGLAHFERIAGLLAVLKRQDIFRQWINAPNNELNGRSPLSLIQERRWETVENLVADILENRGR